MIRKRKAVNLIPLLDIILIILFIFMVNVNTGTKIKAQNYYKLKKSNEASIKILEEEIETSRKQKEKYVFENRTLQDSISDLEIKNRKMTALADRAKSLLLARNKLTNENEKLQFTINSIQSLLENKESILKKQRDELSVLRTNNSDLNLLKNKISAERDNLIKQKIYLEQKNAQLTNENNFTLTQLTEVKKKALILGHKLELQQTDNTNYKVDTEKLNSKLKNMERLLQESEIEKLTLQKDLQEVESINKTQIKKLDFYKKNEDKNWQQIQQKYEDMKEALKAYKKTKEIENIQETTDQKALAGFAKKYFWLITIQLDKEDEEHNRQPVRIFDKKHNINAPNQIRNADQFLVLINNFISDYPDGGRDPKRVAIMIKAHESANGNTQEHLKLAITRGKWNNFKTTYFK